MFLAYVYRFPDKWATTAIAEIGPGHYVQTVPVYTFPTASEVLKKIDEMRAAGLRKIRDPGKKHESPLALALGYKSERAMQNDAHVWMLQFKESGIALLLFKGRNSSPAFQDSKASLDEVEKLIANYAY